MKYSISKLFGLLAVVAAFALASCHGDVNELISDSGNSGGGGDDGGVSSGLIISASKSTIEADGDDYVTLSLKLDGVELTADDSTLANVYFKNAVTGRRLERYSTTFSAVKNGKYTLVASYKGRQSENSVVITAKNREKYEPYGQKIMVYDLTGTWCAYCPSMTAALENVDAEWRENMLVLAVHSSSSDVDPYAIPYGRSDLGGAMLSQFGGSGYPCCIYDLAYMNMERTATGIGAIIQQHLHNYPASCGVKINSSSLESGRLRVTASVVSPKGGEYDLGYALLLDNQYYAAGTEADHIYDDIVVAVSPNFLQMSADSKFTLAAGEERSVSFDVENLPYTSSENLRVVVYAFCKRDGRTMVDNANVCAVGESIDYTPVSEVDYTLPDDDVVGEVPEGVVRLFADKTSVVADGVDVVTFKVMYGSEDVSNGRTTTIVRTFNGEEISLAAGANTFATTAAGTYTFKARYYKGGEHFSDNEVTVTATRATADQAQKFRHKMLGMQFTSVGCTYCPMLSTVIGLIDETQPERLVPVSFHVDFNISDPMRIAAADAYYSKFGSSGLPLFVLDMRDGEKMTSVQSVIESEMSKSLANYPPTCGVAIGTSYDASTRTLKVTPRITSNVASSYRYLVFLVESGIEYMQYGASDDYLHNNVVRHAFSDNIYGTRFNGGATLEEGVDTALTSPLTLRLNDAWRVENMRVVVSALTTADGGVTYVCNNTASCKVGESVDYVME